MERRVAFWTKKRTDVEVNEDERHYMVSDDLLEYGLADPTQLPAKVCGGYCCKSGVYMSLPHRDLILKHVALIQAEMDDVQPKDPEDWFEKKIEKDEDFQGGMAIGTEATANGCVFLNQAGRCVLQILTMRNPDLPQLKPFFCRLFPLTVVDGELTYDDHCEGEMVCCSVEENGPVSLLDACEYEFLVALSPEQFRELKQVAGKHQPVVSVKG